jgi:hypothetical protein
MMNNVTKHSLSSTSYDHILVLLQHSKSNFSVLFVTAAKRQSMLDEIERDFEGLSTKSLFLFT